MLCLIHPVSSLPSVTPFWISSPLQEKNTLSALYCSMLSAAFTPRNDIESPFNIPPVEIISHSEISDNSSKFSIELVMTVSFFLFLIFFAIKTAVVDASRKICSPSWISWLIRSAIFCFPIELDFHLTLNGRSILPISLMTAPP